MKTAGLAIAAFLLTSIAFLTSLYYAKLAIWKAGVLCGVVLAISFGLIYLVNQKFEKQIREKADLEKVRQTLKNFLSKVEELIPRAQALHNADVKNVILEICQSMKSMAESDIKFIPPGADTHYQFCETFLYTMEHKPDKETVQRIKLAAAKTLEETSNYTSELGVIKPKAMLLPGDKQAYISSKPQLSLEDVELLINI